MKHQKTHRNCPTCGGVSHCKKTVRLNEYLVRRYCFCTNEHCQQVYTTHEEVFKILEPSRLIHNKNNDQITHSL